MKNRCFYLLCCGIAIGVITGCQSKEQQLKKLVRSWQNRTIILPEYMETKVQGRDTSISEAWKAPYKILSYIDTSDCTSCQARLQEWNQLKRKTDSLHLQVSFLFIVHVKEFEEWEILQQIHQNTIPCIYDRNNEIGKTNSFPSQSGFQTFLLDADNRVLVIGNPVVNEQIERLYLETLKKQFHSL